MTTATADIQGTLNKARQGMEAYLRTALDKGNISPAQFEAARASALPNLSEWLTSTKIDEISPSLKSGLADAVEAGQWEALVNAYRQSLRFGTGGIRGMMAFDRESVMRLQKDGLDARILKGPGTLNNVVLLRTSAGVARFTRRHGRLKSGALPRKDRPRSRAPWSCSELWSQWPPSRHFLSVVLSNYHHSFY